jgi:hypothetical protein
MINTKYPTTKPSLNLDFANTKSLDPRITFRRGTPGTYYDGVTHVKAEENLLSYSENFNDVDNYWAEVRATLTGSQASPIDSTSAYELSQTSTGLAGVLLINENKIRLQIGKQYVSSVYVKASNSNYFAIAEEVSLGTGRPAFTYFDLSNDGEVMLNHENHIASIQNVGNQWYRCSIMFTAKLESDYTVMFYLDGGSSQSTISEPQNVTAGASIYLWGAQLEQRDAVTSYTATTGTPITKYQPKLMTASPDDARFDHDPITGESKGLLIEEQRTNLIDYSEDFHPAYLISPWITNDASVKTDCVIAPDGTLTADKLVENTNTAQHLVTQPFNFQNGTSYTFSIFAKKGESEAMFFNITNLPNVLGEQYVAAKADLNDGTVQLLSGNDASVGSENVGNGWFRFTISGTCTVTATAYLGVRTYDSTGSTTNYLGDGYSGLYIWGAQLETGSFATSYIKTTGASATRSADNASITGENFSSWYRQDQGSIVASASIDMNKRKGGTGMPVYNILKDTTALFGLSRDKDYWYHGIVNNSESTYKYSSDSESATGSLTYDFGDGYLHSYIDQFENLSSTTWTWRERPFVHEHANTLRLGTTIAGNNGSNNLNGHIKKLAYYPQRLTNEQLQNLTK